MELWGLYAFGEQGLHLLSGEHLHGLAGWGGAGGHGTPKTFGIRQRTRQNRSHRLSMSSHSGDVFDLHKVDRVIRGHKRCDMIAGALDRQFG